MERYVGAFVLLTSQLICVLSVELTTKKRPVIYGAPPPPDSHVKHAKWTFMDGTHDFLGEPYLINNAATHIKCHSVASSMVVGSSRGGKAQKLKCEVALPACPSDKWQSCIKRSLTFPQMMSSWLPRKILNPAPTQSIALLQMMMMLKWTTMTMTTMITMMTTSMQASWVQPEIVLAQKSSLCFITPRSGKHHCHSPVTPHSPSMSKTQYPPSPWSCSKEKNQ